MHGKETKEKGASKVGLLPCNLTEHENKCGKVVPDEHLKQRLPAARSGKGGNVDDLKANYHMIWIF